MAFDALDQSYLHLHALRDDGSGPSPLTEARVVTLLIKSGEEERNQRWSPFFSIACGAPF